MEPDAIRPDRDKTGKQKNPRRSHLSSQNSAMYTAGGGSSHFDGTMSFGGTTKSTASSVAGELNQARKCSSTHITFLSFKILLFAADNGGGHWQHQRRPVGTPSRQHNQRFALTG
jgi:hypothetical protein